MLRAMDTPPPVHDDHLRRLLDQRAARADVHHGRFPSLSEFSDSPSVYSHARFSPRPMDRAEIDANAAGFNFAIPAQYRGLAAEARERDRDRERMNDPAASMLDLEDDDTTYSNPVSPQPYRDDSPSPDPDDPEDDEPASRMSLLGPKMRFHSPAPWEVEDDLIQGQEEPDDDARSFISRRGRNKAKGDGFMKGFGLVPSSAARGTSASRPSGESSLSNGKDKKSFETTSSYVSVSHGALHALAQDSMSSTSLATPPASSRGKFSMGRARTRTISNSNPPANALPPRPTSPHSNTYSTRSSSNASPVTHPTRSTSPTPSVFSNALTRTNTRSSSRAESPTSYAGKYDYVHPYANPDLAYDRSSVHIFSAQMASHSAGGHEVNTSNSNATLPDSITTRTSSPSRSASATTITMTPDTSAASVGNSSADVHSLKRGAGIVQGKPISGPISGPISVEHTPLRSMGHSAKSKSRDAKFTQGNQLAGWSELPASPTFTLISLQEAQAQARERSRTVTGQLPANIPFLQTEPPSRYTPDLPSNIATRARARSTSAGAKAKNALQSLTTTSSSAAAPRADGDTTPSPQQTNGAPPSRALRHKKSGFMRLFNGKEKEKEKPISVTPPAVPSSPVPVVPKMHKTSSARVPVPTLSPSLVSQISGSYFQSVVKEGDKNTDNENLVDTRQRLITKRNGPPLSIVPPSSEPPNSRHANPSSPLSPMSNYGDNRSRSTLIPESTVIRVPSPSSAPPATTAFPSLSLRPVSTIFSAHFANHIVDADSPLEMEPDTSTTNGFSPLSLDYPMRPSEQHSMPMVAGDDPALVIQTLQDQIVSTRKAWQHQIWELEGQVRDLRAEIDEMRSKEASGERCILCGGTSAHMDEHDGPSSANGSLDSRSGVVNRPRARTGVGTRFGAATE